VTFEEMMTSLWHDPWYQSRTEYAIAEVEEALKRSTEESSPIAESVVISNFRNYAINSSPRVPQSETQRLMHAVCRVRQ
jgi:hypothetical protein